MNPGRNESDRPKMSVILAASLPFDTIRQTVTALKAQELAHELELVLVTPSAEHLGAPPQDLRGFAQVSIVEANHIISMPHARAQGVFAATAPVVVLGEDHSFPQAGWAEALIRAHEEPWGAVGPAILNGNPQHLVSWADFLMAYGPWCYPVAAGPQHDLPGHNSSYKRELLLDYGEQLGTMLDAEIILHRDLRSRGCPLYLEPAARITHLNFFRYRSWLRAQLASGQVFAGRRAASWGAGRRLLYVVGAPLVPLVRFWRIAGDLRRIRAGPWLILRLFPVLLLGLSVRTVGETIGLVVGVRGASERRAIFETGQSRGVTE
jgi:hypothetical protein